MTIASLQKIITLEEELFGAEQAEQERAVLWLKERQAAILRKHEQELAVLDQEKEKVKARAAEEAKQKADAIVQKARNHADYLDRLDDTVLSRHLEKTFRFFLGKEP